MSAKWRRSKRNLKRFNISKVINRVRTRKAPKTLRAKALKDKGQAHPYRYRVRKVSGEKRLREPKPLIDVLEGNDDIAVFAEFAGFNKEDLKIHVKDQRLILSAEAADRKYRKSLNLPKRVIPSTICTTYKNGVLEIRVKKAIEERAIDKIAG